LIGPADIRSSKQVDARSTRGNLFRLGCDQKWCNHVQREQAPWNKAAASGRTPERAATAGTLVMSNVARRSVLSRGAGSLRCRHSVPRKFQTACRLSALHRSELARRAGHTAFSHMAPAQAQGDGKALNTKRRTDKPMKNKLSDGKSPTRPGGKEPARQSLTSSRKRPLVGERKRRLQA
jgi:hypothetical protein